MCFFFNPSWCGEGLLLFSSCSVMSNSLQPHGLQHASLPYPSLSPRVCSNSCPLNRWCHPTISSSVVPFSCLQCLPASRSFPVSRLLASDGQSVGASASVSVLPMNIQGWYSLELTYNTYYVLNSVLNALHIWIQLILTTSPYFIYLKSLCLTLDHTDFLLWFLLEI